MSTEFRVGLDGNRNSSKVLKPPGGGSSDIFGTALPAPQNTTPRIAKKTNIFGEETEDDGSKKPQEKKEVQVTPAKFVRRNPITGEGYGESSEPHKSSNENIKKANEKPTDIPKVVQTSVRVRNPPGGKSSGIF